MTNVANEESEFRVTQTPRRLWVRRWWLWFLLVAFALILLCYQGGKAWKNYQREKFNQFLLELSEKGIKADVRSVDVRSVDIRSNSSWTLRYQQYLPSFITELFESKDTYVACFGDKVTTESLNCLTKLPNV